MCDLYLLWVCGSGWCLNGVVECVLCFLYGDQVVDVMFVYGCDGLWLKVDDYEVFFILQCYVDIFIVMLGLYKVIGQVYFDGDMFYVFIGGVYWMFECYDLFVYVGEVDDEGGKLIVLMFGKVIVVLVVLGQIVIKGVLLVVMEVMKMEYMFIVFVDGVVELVLYGVGDQVMEGVQLLVFKLVE